LPPWHLAAVAALTGTSALRTTMQPAMAVIAGGVFTAYVLTVEAFKLATAAPVVVVRESGVVIAAALARLTLVEPVPSIASPAASPSSPGWR
jgi:hypothetical protein